MLTLATSFPSEARKQGVSPGGLLLPGALLVAIGAQLLAALVFIDLRFPAFFQ
jgi:hypothetical protein